MPEKAKIYCFTKYSSKGPSSRYRTFQYLPVWMEYYNIEINVLLDDWYFEKNLNILSKSLKIISSFYKRKKLLNKITQNDLVWIEYELFPYLGSFAERKLKKSNIPFILDYDDAIFHGYDQHRVTLVRNLLRTKIPKIMSLASYIVTGSPYLTAYAKKRQKNTIEIPTSINIDEYNIQEAIFSEKPKNSFIIGWLGSNPTSINLEIIKDAFIQFSKETLAELWLMGYDENKKSLWEGLPVKFFKWSTQSEKSFLNSIDVGIMPLYDFPYNHGKCGFKLIQYMAMGKPTISTPMEANVKIDRNNINYFATQTHEWVSAFRQVQKEMPDQSFIENKKNVHQYYNTKVNVQDYINLFNNLINNKV